VHFFAGDPPAAIARKALRVNLSDLAAKGAAPLGFVLTLALPGDWTTAWLAAFAAALGEDAAAYGCPLVGGDTVRMPGPLTLSITAFGTVPAGRMVRRAGARPGDVIAVTGNIGDAALGLAMRHAAGAGWVAALTEGSADSGRRYHPAPAWRWRLPCDHASTAMTCRTGSSATWPSCCGCRGERGRGSRRGAALGRGWPRSPSHLSCGCGCYRWRLQSVCTLSPQQLPT
jgi:thiamin-phosphate kinase